MSVSVLLYTSKTLRNGEHSIVIRLIKNRKLKYISIGQSSKLEWCSDLSPSFILIFILLFTLAH